MPRGTGSEASLLVGNDCFLGDLVDPDSAVRLSAGTRASRVRDLFLKHGIGAAPVIDEHSRPVGILATSDLLAAADRLEEATVEDVMTAFVFSLPVRASLGQAAALMAYEGVGQLVVVDDAGSFAGLVTALEVARWMGRTAGYVGLLGESPAESASETELSEDDDLDSPHVPALADVYYAQL